MMTVRQIQRLWDVREYGRLYRMLSSGRAEGRFRFEGEDRAALAAAFAIIRLDELAQPQVPLYGRLVRALLAEQEADGGWGDAPTTALCIRALACGRGHGLAIQRAAAYLALLQKEEGIWPAVPIRRMPSDGHVSAFVLSQLIDQPDFRQAVRLDSALAWFDQNRGRLDDETRILWDRANLRSGPRPRPARFTQPSLSRVA